MINQYQDPDDIPDEGVAMENYYAGFRYEDHGDSEYVPDEDTVARTGLHWSEVSHFPLDGNLKTYRRYTITPFSQPKFFEGTYLAARIKHDPKRWIVRDASTDFVEIVDEENFNLFYVEIPEDGET